MASLRVHPIASGDDLDEPLQTQVSDKRHDIALEERLIRHVIGRPQLLTQASDGLWLFEAPPNVFSDIIEGDVRPLVDIHQNVLVSDIGADEVLAPDTAGRAQLGRARIRACHFLQHRSQARSKQCL